MAGAFPADTGSRAASGFSAASWLLVNRSVPVPVSNATFYTPAFTAEAMTPYLAGFLRVTTRSPTVITIVNALLLLRLTSGLEPRAGGKCADRMAAIGDAREPRNKTILVNGA